MDTNTAANSIEALRRKMLIAGAAGLHDGKPDGRDDSHEVALSTDDGKDVASSDHPDDLPIEKTTRA